MEILKHLIKNCSEISICVEVGYQGNENPGISTDIGNVKNKFTNSIILLLNKWMFKNICSGV